MILFKIFEKNNKFNLIAQYIN